ncbi:MAG: sulfatase-like hydrolase/transferase [Pirellulales bacterium]
MRRTLSLVVSLLAAVGAAAPGFAAAPKKPNVVFVLVDDLGYADIGAYGCTDIKTPNIDRLAREGLRFTDFYSNAPVCTPTRCAFITGRWQQRTGFEWALGFSAEQSIRKDDRYEPIDDKLALGLPTTQPSIAKLLKTAGYATGCVGKWHLGYKPEFGPLAHGFDEYFGNLLGHADFYTHRYKDGTDQLRDGDKPVEVEGYLTDLYNARAVDFIRRRAPAGPFLLYVPYNAVHFPFQTPDDPASRMDPNDMYRGTRDDYRRMVERIDRGVGEMLVELEKQGELEDTLFLFSSDNGGERLSDNRPLFNHKQSLWEGGIRVPCLARWPVGLPKGKVVRQPAITMDLTATIAAACGAMPSAETPFDGIDLLPILRGDASEVERTFFWRVARSDRYQKAIRHGNWKYVLDGQLPLLFDLSNDVGERQDLGYRRPDVLKDLQRRLAEWEADLAKNPPPQLVH